jgi:type II secretory pathway pseudopilin PulG
MHLRHSERRGVILLESMIALALIGIAALTTISLSSMQSDRIGGAVRSSVEMSRASAFMDAVTLWSRLEFDRRLGTRPQGPYTLSVSRLTEALYALELRDGLTNRLLISTAVYRQASADAAP